MGRRLAVVGQGAFGFMGDPAPRPAPVRSLHLGDNLDVLRSLPDGSVDLCVIDPPYNTGRRFEGKAGAFDDRWTSRDAYLDFMRPRLVEIHRTLSARGSLYLQCDDHAWFHLATECDRIFHPNNLMSIIKWKRSHSHGNCKRKFPVTVDTIIFHVKSRDAYTWNPPVGVDGEPVGDLWTDIKPLNAQARERVDYPTQKPLALLERIIRASSDPGDVVLDAFAGSGTTLVAAQRLGRSWIGIDRSHDAHATIRARLARDCGLEPHLGYRAADGLAKLSAG